MVPRERWESRVSVDTVFHVLLWISLEGGGSFPRLPGFYCLAPRLGLVCCIFAESFNGEHLLLGFLVRQAEEICVQRGVGGRRDLGEELAE